jgi:hypothetical protein
VALINLASPKLDCRTVQISAPEWEIERVKPTLTEQEVEAERQRAAVVKSDLDLLMDEDGW